MKETSEMTFVRGGGHPTGHPTLIDLDILILRDQDILVDLAFSII